MASYPFCLAPRGTPLRDSFERYFTENGQALPEVPVESGSALMIRQVMMNSNFLALLSPDQMQVEVQAGWLCELTRLPRGYQRTIGMTTRASLRPTEVQAEFFADLQAAATEIAE